MSKVMQRGGGNMGNRGDRNGPRRPQQSSGTPNRNSNSSTRQNGPPQVKKEPATPSASPRTSQTPQNKDKEMREKSQDRASQDNDLSASHSGKRFTGRCRLFVGNLTNDIGEDEFKKMFTVYGEVSEVFLNTQKGFGFIRLDTRPHAEAAKNALDGTERKKKILRVRFATHGAALKVRNLPSTVSNELLSDAFSQFGNVERAVVIVDDRGRPTGEGIIEFARKPGAMQALNRIKEGVFLMTSAPRPIMVEPLEQRDEEDGLPEKYVPKNLDYKKDREKEPRFAPPGSFEYQFGLNWKQLDEEERMKEEDLKKDFERKREEMDMKMDDAMNEYQANVIRQELMRKQEELRQFEARRQNDQMRRTREMEMRQRQDEERQRVEDDRRSVMQRQEEMMRQQQRGMRNRDDHLLMQQAAAIREMQGGNGGGRGGPPPMQPPPIPPAGLGVENRSRQGGGMQDQDNMGGNGGMGFRGGNMGPAQMRQSRFDQPPSGNGGSQNFGGPGIMGPGPSQNMQGARPRGPQGMMNMMGGMQGERGNMGDRGGMDRGGPRGGMDRRRPSDRGGRDEYGDNKRPRY